MDIQKIIKKLQDLEKIKFLVFDDNQRKFFEDLQKPKILKMKNIKNPCYSVKNDFEFVNEIEAFDKIKGASDNYSFLLEENPINQRFLKMLGPSFSSSLIQMRNLQKSKKKPLGFDSLKKNMIGNYADKNH